MRTSHSATLEPLAHTAGPFAELYRIQEGMGRLLASEADQVFQQLAELARVWHTIDPSENIRLTAKRFLRVHDLRAADALQLAAAFVASEGRPGTLELACLDERLAAAARKEGFRVIDRSNL